MDQDSRGGGPVSFTPITITGDFTRPDQDVPQGTVTMTLSCRLVNGTEVAVPTPIVGVVNTATVGLLLAPSLKPLMVLANNDAATEPAGSTYSFVIELDNAPLVEFDAVVPATAPGATIDITALMPIAS